MKDTLIGAAKHIPDDFPDPSDEKYWNLTIYPDGDSETSFIRWLYLQDVDKWFEEEWNRRDA